MKIGAIILTCTLLFGCDQQPEQLPTPRPRIATRPQQPAGKHNAENPPSGKTTEPPAQQSEPAVPTDDLLTTLGSGIDADRHSAAIELGRRKELAAVPLLLANLQLQGRIEALSGEAAYNPALAYPCCRALMEIGPGAEKAVLARFAETTDPVQSSLLGLILLSLQPDGGQSASPGTPESALLWERILESTASETLRSRFAAMEAKQIPP